MRPTRSLKAIKKACRIVGSQAEMARLLHVSPPTVNQWVKGVRPVPGAQCPEIERLTNRAVLSESLRPDINFAYLRAVK